jgi:hypothetical protein
MGDRDMFEGVGDQSLRTRSSNAPAFTEGDEMKLARIRSALNEIAVEDPEETEDWSDASI